MKLIIFYSLKETTMKNKRVSDLPAIARRSLTSLRFRKENWSENYREHCIENEVFPFGIFLVNVNEIRIKLRICSHLLKKYITEDIIFCAVKFVSTKSSVLQSILKVNKRKTRFAQFGQSWNENTHLIQPLHESEVLLSSLNNFLWSEK